MKTQRAGHFGCLNKGNVRFSLWRARAMSSGGGRFFLTGGRSARTGPPVLDARQSRPTELDPLNITQSVQSHFKPRPPGTEDRGVLLGQY